MHNSLLQDSLFWDFILPEQTGKLQDLKCISILCIHMEAFYGKQ
jgi:hypothetical protein